MPQLSNFLGSDPVRSSVRFPLQLEVILSAGEREYVAMTEDVSANGILFVGNELPPEDTHVNFRLKLPAERMGGEDVVLHCTGRIVRRTQEAGGRATAAAVIDEYSLKAEHV